MQLFEQSLIVDESSKGLANVVVFLRKSSRVKNESATEKLVMDQKNCEFLTPVFAARVGQAVDVKNSDPIGHNTNISGSSFNQLIPSGDSTVFYAKSGNWLASFCDLQHSSVDESLCGFSERRVCRGIFW